jgi:transposase-like protein
MTGLPVDQAAAALGITKGTLRRWLRQGCPAVTRGRRGRGQAALVDPEQVMQWREAGERQRIYLELAGAVPVVLAKATCEAVRMTEGIDKRRLAGVQAATWYVATSAVLDHLRESCPSVPEVSEIPDEIQQLRKIAR